MKKAVMFFLCILYIVCLFSANAETEYRNVGSNDSQFQLGRGIFSAVEELELSYYTAGLSNGKHIPLVADIDKDGINEIYVIDGDDIKVYEGMELDYIASFDYGDSGDRVSFPIIYDIDNDDELEYIFIDESKSPYEEVFILGFNGTDLINETSFGLSSAGNGDSIIGCIAPNKCLVVTGKYRMSQDLPNTVEVLAVSINSTTQEDLLSVHSDSSANEILLCRSAIPFIATTTEGALDEYVFTFAEASNGGVADEGVYTFWVSVDADNQLNLEHTAYENIYDADGYIFGLAGNSRHCDDDENIRSQFTSPLVNIDLADEPFSQSVVAFMENKAEFVMHMYDYEGGFIDDFPETDDSNGEIVSNVFRANAFPDSNGRGFCVVGFQGIGAEYDTSDLQQNIVCGSDYSGELVETFEFSIPTESYGYNNSYDVGNHRANLLTHSAQHSNELTEGVDLSEVVTTYGIFSLDYDSCEINPVYGRGFCDAERIFDNGAGKSALISVDIEGIGNDDLIAMTDLGIYVYDDGISNKEVKQVDVFYNPCPTDVIIKVNETMLLTVTGYDGNSDYALEDDLLSYNVTIYKGNYNEMKDNYDNVTSGSPRSFTFTLNKTIASGLIEIIVTDNIAGNDNFVIEQTFTVANDGVEYGDVTCTNSFSDVAEEGEECTTDDDCETGFGCVDDVCVLISGECLDNDDCPDGYNCVEQPDATKKCMSTNLLKRSATELNDLLGISLVAVWLLIMIIFDIYLVSKAHEEFKGMEAKYLFAIIGFIDLIWIVMGVMGAILSFWIILLLILIAIIIGVVFAINKFEGQAGS